MVKHKGGANPGRSGELGLVEKLRQMAEVIPRPGTILGIGDDCAIVSQRGSREDLLYTTDMLIEGVHFERETHRPADAGWKALARGLSDIAAMGGEPRHFLVSFAAAPWTDQQWIAGFYGGMLALAFQHGASLIGGDLAKTDRLMCDVVVTGAVPRGKALRRDGARAGDAIYVSGELGVSALGLKRRRGYAWNRHLRPEPRLALGRFLREHVKATAAMDLSDGLSLDLHRLCAASGLRAEITMPPVFSGATRQQALHGGEDYELLFTAPEKADVPAEFERVRLTRIGTLRRGRAGVVLDGKDLEPAGWDHFR